jgi:general stress protein YciG
LFQISASVFKLKNRYKSAASLATNAMKMLAMPLVRTASERVKKAGTPSKDDPQKVRALTKTCQPKHDNRVLIHQEKDMTQNSNSGNFANDREKASEAGKKGGQNSGGNFANDREKASEAGRKGGQNSHGGGRS